MNLGIPGISWCSPVGISAQPTEGKLHTVGFAYHWSQLGLQGLYHGPRHLPVLWKRLGTTGKGGKARHTKHVFNRYGDAHQWPGIAPCSSYLISSTGKLERTLRLPAKISAVSARFVSLYGGCNQCFSGQGSGFELSRQLP